MLLCHWQFQLFLTLSQVRLYSQRAPEHTTSHLNYKIFIYWEKQNAICQVQRIKQTQINMDNWTETYVVQQTCQRWLCVTRQVEPGCLQVPLLLVETVSMKCRQIMSSFVAAGGHGMSCPTQWNDGKTWQLWATWCHSIKQIMVKTTYCVDMHKSAHNNN